MTLINLYQKFIKIGIIVYKSVEMFTFPCGSGKKYKQCCGK